MQLQIEVLQAPALYISKFMKAVVVGNAKFGGSDLIAPAQLYPFFDHEKKLHDKLGLAINHVQAETFVEIEEVCQQVKADVFIIRPSWQENPVDAERVMKSLRIKHPTSKIIFLDPWDQVSTRFFNVLPYVDKLLKYQRLRDISKYKESLAGGTMITDFLAKDLGYEINEWNVSSEIPQGYEHRIGTSWNVTLIDRFKKALFQKTTLWNPKPRKDIDLFCRVSYGQEGSKDWYGLYRRAAIEALKPLESKYKLAVSGEYVGARAIPSRQYFKEIKRSHLVFSPFGWGETTWRDYEAVCYDCLLIKPSMEHIDTEPNIYIAGETYVPIKWDFSDLEEKCQYYLQNPDEAARIIKNARSTYTAYFEQDKFVQTISQLITASE